MDTVIKILPIVVVVLVVFLLKEALSLYKYARHCKLHEAAKTGDIDTVRRLLEAGHPVNAVDPSFGLTPLHFAVRNGCTAVARLLIDNGASLTQPSTQGITPLDWASVYLDPNQRDTLLGVNAGERETDDV
ncbi:MAG: ankyrin repeat domain-containing protein [Candidatus Competibacteraceae bacterium]|jgi:ankyrin repeat protein|nr:ankyrin repeat domain-containing protein [Candidatus Competibacteraceae bacterium]